MGHRPLIKNMEIAEIRDQLREKGIRKIKDISEWDSNGNWQRCNFPRIPEQLNTQLVALNDAISDFAPVHIDDEDIWGKGKNGVYTAS